jgi:hypothetical protein
MNWDDFSSVMNVPCSSIAVLLAHIFTISSTDIFVQCCHHHFHHHCHHDLLHKEPFQLFHHLLVNEKLETHKTCFNIHFF